MFAPFMVGVYYVHFFQNIVSNDTYFECICVRFNMNYGNISENNYETRVQFIKDLLLLTQTDLFRIHQKSSD